MGGAQPLAITMNDGVALCIEVDPHRIERRLETRYLDEVADSLDDAIARCVSDAKAAGRALSIGLLGNAADVVPKLLDLGFDADIVTDQTSAHDPLSYVPNDLSPEAAAELRTHDPDEYVRRSRAGDGRALRGDGRVPRRGRRGLRLRQQPARRGRARAASTGPSTTPASSPRTSARCSARARARSAGSRCRAIPPTSPRPTARCSRSSPTTSASLGGSTSPRSGSRSRVCRRASAGSATASARALGLRFNEMVRVGRGLGADRDRPRPSRLRLGRLALSRDRGDGRRQRRDRRLAAAQRAGQHRVAARRG